MVKPPIFFAVLITALGATCAARADDDGGRAAYVKASKYFEAEEYEAALPHFEKAYAQSGARPATAFGLAQCLRAMKRYDAAIGFFEEYLASDPDNAASVRETLGLLKEIAQRNEKMRAEEETRRAKAEAEAEAEEATRRAEATRPVPPLEEHDAEASRAETEAAQAAKAADGARATEAASSAEVHVSHSSSPTLVLPVEPQVEESSIASSPVFWIVTGAAVVGGAIAVGVLASRGSPGYGGNTDVVLAPLRGVQ